MAGSGDCQAMVLTSALANQQWALGKLFRPLASAAYSAKWGLGCQGGPEGAVCARGGASAEEAFFTPQG